MVADHTGELARAQCGALVGGGRGARAARPGVVRARPPRPLRIRPPAPRRPGDLFSSGRGKHWVVRGAQGAERPPAAACGCGREAAVSRVLTLNRPRSSLKFKLIGSANTGRGAVWRGPQPAAKP